MADRAIFTGHATQDWNAVMETLTEVVAEDPEKKRVVVELIGVIIEKVTAWSDKAALPSAEAEAWEALGAHFDGEATSAARARRFSAFADLIANSLQGDAAVAALLGVDRTRISQRVRNRSLYSFQSGDERLYPRWQFVDHRTVRELKTVLSVLDPSLHPLVVDHWFTTPSVDLEVGDEPMTPVVWLETGGSPEHLAELVPGA